MDFVMEKFDVFLSFRKIDTGRSFVSHLYHSLIDKQIRTFKNDEDHRSGDRQEFREIEDSKIAIAVISKNYISSISCLNELERMIECKEKGSLVIVPVFYEVDPRDFVKEADNLARKLGLNHSNKKELKEVNKWRDALVDLTLLYEAYASGVEEDAEMINKVISCIARHLRATRARQTGRSMDYATVPLPPSWSDLSIIKLITMAIQGRDQWSFSRRGMDQEEEESISVNTRLIERRITFTGTDSVQFSRTNDLVGMDRKMKEVDTLLKLNSRNGVSEIGIWGVGGAGKTTLARCIYEHISPQYQHYCYYTNNKNSSSPTCIDVLEEIIRASLVKPMPLDLVAWIFDVVKVKLGHRKVLLVVDGVECIDQLKHITSVARLFGPGSRLILVSQDRNLLVECNLKLLYEVESLRYEEALQLFTQSAFDQKDIPRGFHQLSLRAVLIAGRLPLALKVLGSSLHGRNIKEWEFEILKLDKRFAEVSGYTKYPPNLSQYCEEDVRGSLEKDSEGSKFKPNIYSSSSRTFDVFLSFYAHETRRTIISFLRGELVSRGISTSPHDQEIKMGVSIAELIIRALENSKVAVVVLSEKYPTSSRCLDELLMIMRLREEKKIEVIPIFYRIDPSDVRHLRGNFELNMYKEHERAEKVPIWREALASIAKLEGIDSRIRQDEATVVQDIAELISEKLQFLP